MLAADTILLARDQQSAAAKLQAKVDRDLERMRAAVELIKRMNRIYQERLDGNGK